MLLMAHESGRSLTTKVMAETLGVSTAHLSKVIQRLHRANLITSTRGPRGGSRLARDPSTITLLEIYETIEGPLSETGCLLPQPLTQGTCCLFGTLLRDLNERIRREFAARTLREASQALKEQGCRNFSPGRDRGAK